MRANGRIGLCRRRHPGADPQDPRWTARPTASSPIATDGKFDVAALLAKARAWPGLEGMDLAKEVSCRQMYRWAGGKWRLGDGL